MCIFGYCIFNPISAALHSAMACSSFPDPMNFWLKCFHILEDLQVHKNKGWRACMISGRSKWRRKCQECSVVIYFLQPKDWSEWSNTCYDVEVDQPWAHATNPDECQQLNGSNDSMSWQAYMAHSISLSHSIVLFWDKKKNEWSDESVNLCQDVAISNMPAGLLQMSVTYTHTYT